MTEETGVVDSPQTEEAQIADASTEDLRFLLGTEQPAVDTPEQPEPTEDAIPDQGEQVPEGVETPQEPVQEEPEETEAERLAKRRIRPRSALDQQVLDLYKSEAFDGSFADASRVIFGQQEAQPQQQQFQQQSAEPPPDPLKHYDDRILSINNEISELELKVDEAAENLDTVEALKLQREINRRELEANNLRNTKDSYIRRERERAHDTHRSKAMESRERAMEAIPELRDKDSLTRKQFDEFVRHNQQNPDYASVFDSPLWPEILTREFAMMMQAHAPEAPPAPEPQAPVMGNQAQVLTSGTTTQPANTPLTAGDVDMSKMTNDQLYALLGQDDGRRDPLR